MVENNALTIGIFINLNPSGGGIYQYSLTMLDALYSLKEEDKLQDDIVILYTGTDESALYQINKYGFKTISFDRVYSHYRDYSRYISIIINRIYTNIMDINSKLLRNIFPVKNIITSTSIAYRPHLNHALNRLKINIMIYPAPSPFAFESGVPYIMAIHDLQHRIHPEFPEVTEHGEWEGREYLFKNGSVKSLMTLVDSNVGKDDLLKYYSKYGLREDQVKVLPFLPPTYLNKVYDDGIKNKYGLPDAYLFYPAQFWPHKNHIRIVQALSILKDEHDLIIHIVFSGSCSGKLREKTFESATNLAKNIGVYDQVHYLGYVPESDMSSLYSGAFGLIMPTFFGPTNIPPLEAWLYSCPVITSNIRGINEQMGDAAILINPCSAESIADGIYRLWVDKELYEQLVKNGKKRLSQYTASNYKDILNEALKDVKTKYNSR